MEPFKHLPSSTDNKLLIRMFWPLTPGTARRSQQESNVHPTRQTQFRKGATLDQAMAEPKLWVFLDSRRSHPRWQRPGAGSLGATRDPSQVVLRSQTAMKSRKSHRCSAGCSAAFSVSGLCKSRRGAPPGLFARIARHHPSPLRAQCPASAEASIASPAARGS